MEEIKIEINQYKQLIKQLIPEITEKQMNYIIFLLLSIEYFQTFKSAHLFLKNLLSLPSYDSTMKRLNELEPILADFVYESANISLKDSLNKILNEFDGNIIFFDRQYPNRGKIIKKNK